MAFPLFIPMTGFAGKVSQRRFDDRPVHFIEWLLSGRSHGTAHCDERPLSAQSRQFVHVINFGETDSLTSFKNSDESFQELVADIPKKGLVPHLPYPFNSVVAKCWHSLD